MWNFGWKGEDLEVKYSIAARMVQKLTGTAKIRANLLDVRHLRPQRPFAAIAEVTDSDGNVTTPGVPAVPADWRQGIDYLLDDLEKMPGIPQVVKKGEPAQLVLQEPLVAGLARRCRTG